MNCKLLVFAFCFVMSTFLCNAQNKEQEGLVKTRGRLDSEGKVIPGVALPDASVILKGGNSTVSEKNGEFSILVPTEKYYLQSVQKQGYEIVDQDVLSKQYAYSKNPLVIVMEMPQQQFEDELAAERKIRRTLTRQLHEREDEIERLKEEKKISDEEYRQALNKLYDDTENNEKLISDMAERYSKIDYDYLDDFYVKVSNYILNGELTKADSMLNTRGNIDSDIESLNQLRDANAKERAELSKRQKKLKKSESIAQHQMEDIAQRCYRKYEIFKMQHQNDSALYYLELRASLDTMNVEWMMDAGKFVGEYIADYEKALCCFNKVINIVKDDNSLALYERQSYHNMGVIYELLGEYEKAIECCYEALNVDNLWEYPEIYNVLGNIYSSLGEYDKAKDSYQKAFDLNVENDGENTIAISTYYNNIGSVYSSQGKYEEALECVQKSLDIVIETNNDFKTVAGLYNNLGVIYNELGQYDNALNSHTKSIEIRREIFDIHPDIAMSYNNIGSIYKELSNYNEAIDYYEKSLGVYIEIFGDKHPVVAIVYNNIATVCEYMGKFSEAIYYYDLSLKIRENVLGEESIDVGILYNNKGVLNKKLLNYDESIANYIKSLEIFRKELGEEHPYIAIIYSNIATIYSNKKEDYANADYDKANEYNEKSLNVKLKLYGENHPQVATSYNNIGRMYYNVNKYEEALLYYEKSLAILINTFGNEHFNIAAAYCNIADTYLKLENTDKSISVYQKSYEIFVKLLGEDNYALSMPLVGIADSYMTQSDYMDALNYYNEAMDIVIKSGNMSILSLDKVYLRIISCYEKLGDEKMVNEYTDKLKKNND